MSRSRRRSSRTRRASTRPRTSSIGDARGDELPEGLRTSGDRRKVLREAKQALDAERAAQAKKIPRDRTERLVECRRRLRQDWELERHVVTEHAAWHAAGIASDGSRRMVGARHNIKPYPLPAEPAGKINVSDPDSRNLKTTRGWVQGYNAQAVVGEGQIILAAEISTESLDTANLAPMVKTAIGELEAAGVTDTPGVVLADAGYWTNDAIETLCGEGIPTLVAPDADRRKEPRPGRRGGPYDFARRVLAGGQALRASDADRERLVAALRDHYAAGRLSDGELDDRVASAYRAKTLADLDGLMLDLPSPGSALPAKAAVRRVPATRSRTQAGRALATSVRIHATVYVLVNVMLIAIWAASGGGYFWPIWPLLGWGIGVGCHAAPLLAGVGTRRVPQELARPSSIDDVEASARSEQLDLGAAAAPDGTVTILFSDIEGSTELNARLGDVRWLELLRMHHAIVRREVRQHGGFEVKAQGDGFMIALPSARRGAQCALAIQRAIQAELGSHPEGPIRVRIGMHSGEAMRDDDDDFYGRNVSLAARIAEHARADEVLASAVVKQLAESAGDICFTDERVVELKGLGEQAVYTVVAR